MDKVIIKNLLARGIIGVNDWERTRPQNILINIIMFTDTRRAAQTIYYSLAGREAGAIMETLYGIYCEPVKAPLPPVAAEKIEA